MNTTTETSTSLDAEFLKKGRVARMVRERGDIAEKYCKEESLHAMLRQKHLDYLFGLAPEDVRQFLTMTRALEELIRAPSFELRIAKEVYEAYGFTSATDAKKKLGALAVAWEGDVKVETDFNEADGSTTVKMAPVPETPVIESAA